MSGPPFWGKYRGVVTDNQDPLMQGRIRARVDDVLGEAESPWALPCAPHGGARMGFFAVPAIKAKVWIEFEHGDPDKPVWAGCFWAETEIPPTLLVPPKPWEKVMIRTEGGHSILLDDTPGTGGITLETSGGAKIVMNAQGIEITSGKGASIKLQGPTVQVNDGALEVI